MNAPAREARAHVMCEHERVCELVAELVREVMWTGRDVGHHVVRERLALLRHAVERAVDTEERELIPLLRESDAWGPVRVERVRDRHARVLCAVRAFEEQVDIERGGDLVSCVEQLIAALSSDLEEEREAAIASARDEDGTVVVDQEPD